MNVKSYIIFCVVFWPMFALAQEMSIGFIPKLPEIKPEEEKSLFQTLENFAKANAGNPEEPWFLAHGITAFGKDFVGWNKQKAIDLIARFAESAVIKEKNIVGFNPQKENHIVDSHRDLMLKTFLSAGLSLDHTFTTAQGKTFLLKDLLETSLLRFEVNSSIEFWHELPWTLVSYNLALPYEYHWKNYRGEKFYLPQMYDYAFKTLEKENEDIEAWMTQQKGQFGKYQAKIFSHPCGGFHYYHGALLFLREENLRKNYHDRLKKQIDILFYRLEKEPLVYDRVKIVAELDFDRLAIQQLKFFGHFLELASTLEKNRIWKFDENQKKAVIRARKYLLGVIKRMIQRNTYARIDSVKLEQKQLFQDLVGDSCHAINGLRYWNK